MAILSDKQRMAQKALGLDKQNNSTKFIQNCLIFVAVALPLFMLPTTYSVFDLPKAMLLLVLVSLLALAWALRIATEGSLAWRRTPLDIPLLFLFIVLLGSTLLSANPGTSLTGPSISDRHESVGIWIAYLFIAIAAGQFLHQRKVSLVFVKAVVMTAFAIAVYSVFQRFGIDFFQYDVAGVDTIRPPGTLGQPTYLGMYLSLALPLSYALVVTFTKKTQRLMYACSTGMIAVALVFTYTRAAWLAAAVAVLFTALFIVSRDKRSRRLLMGISFGIIVLALLAILASGSLNLTSDRISAAISLSGSAAERLAIWESTLSLIKERPVLGWGIETFEDIFPRVEPVSLVRTKVVAWVDRPHNQMLYIGSSMGIIGLLAYLWFLVTALSTGLRAVRESSRESVPLLAGIAGALIGYSLNELFLFSVVGATPIFWMLAGALQVRSSGTTTRKFDRWEAIGLKLIVIPLVIATSVLAGLFVIADIYYQRGNDALAANEPVRAFYNYETAVKINPWREWYAFALVDATNALSSVDEDLSWRKELAISYLEGAVERNPNNRDLYLALGDLYLPKASDGSASDYERSIKAYEESLKKSPLFIPARLKLAQLLLIEGDPEKALYHLNLVSEIQPENEVAQKLLAAANEALNGEKNISGP